MEYKFQILSIDWDYFIDTDSYTRAMFFPDGGNEKILGHLSNMVWSQRYVEGLRMKKDLQEIPAKIDAIHQLYDRVDKINLYICTESHKDLGTYILKFLPQNICERGLDIINIDFHSDLYNIGPELNCGNWLNKVFEKYPKSTLTWVAREDSETKDIPLALSYAKQINITKEIPKFFNKYVQICFVCKSSIWSPPHLDSAFTRMDKHFRRISADIMTDITLPNRWPEVKTAIEELKKTYAKFNVLESEK